MTQYLTINNDIEVYEVLEVHSDGIYTVTSDGMNEEVKVLDPWEYQLSDTKPDVEAVSVSQSDWAVFQKEEELYYTGQ